MKPFLLALLSTIAVVLAIAGLVVLVAGLWRMFKEVLSRRWPSVPGTILSSTLSSRVPPPSEWAPSEEQEAAGPPPTLYRADIRYSYSVDGHAFTGSAISHEDLEVSSEAMIRGIVERYPPGTSVTVHYDPDDPSQSVLEPGARAASWIMPAAGIISLLTAGALSLFVLWFRQRWMNR